MATAPEDTNLKATVKALVNTQYKRTDLGISGDNARDDLNYLDISKTSVDGQGTTKVDLQYHARRRLISTSENLDLDGVLKNIWDQTLDFDAVKYLVIRNRESTAGRYLTVTFKDEKYRIGPGGSRVVSEPVAQGITSSVWSSSALEGVVGVTSNADITYDIIIIGASKEVSSSGA